MFYQQPPAGDPVCLSRQYATDVALRDVFSPYTPRFLHSGTAALAVAVAASVRLKEVAEPEVILPAYGCPDLVSAVVHAGARPVLVDLEPERPWMDLGQVAASVNSKTVAIIAVSLFGIPERLDAIGALANEAAIVLIEDSAQAFPHAGNGEFWKGDLVVLSFGRGKPVSLLGGGAVLYRDRRFAGLLPDGGMPADSRRVTFRLQAALYNLLLSPRLYWIPQILPFLRLGETHYRQLDGIHPMDSARHALLACNIQAYRARPLDGQDAVANLLKETAGSGNRLIDLPVACGLSQSGKLLRYPLLVDRDRRDELHRCLLGKGQGASIMYPAILAGLPGLEDVLFDAGEYPGASDFAARVLTLPVFNRLQDTDLAKIRACLEVYR